MGEETQSPLHVWCFSYLYDASCVYKTVTLFDAVYFMINFISAIGVSSAEAKFAWPRLVWIVTAAMFLYCSFKGIILFCGYNSNLTNGSLHVKTHDYLQIRKIFVTLYFAYALVVPGLFVMAEFMDAGSRQASESDKNSQRLAALAEGIGYCISCLISAWLQASFQNSLAQATIAITGHVSLAKDEVHV